MKPGEAFFSYPDSADGMLMACTGSYVSQMDRHQFYLEEVSIYSKLPTEQGTTCVCRLGTNSTRLQIRLDISTTFLALSNLVRWKEVLAED